MTPIYTIIVEPTLLANDNNQCYYHEVFLLSLKISD